MVSAEEQLISSILQFGSTLSSNDEQVKNNQSPEVDHVYMFANKTNINSCLLSEWSIRG